MEQATQNAYLEHVVNQKCQLERDLQVRRACAKKLPMIANPEPQGDDFDDEELDRSGGAPASGGHIASNPVDVRVTGWWRWKNVLVPPNALVVHTRRGHEEPLHCGLGVSFRFDPVTDSYLVVPSAMQTIIINANCICRERQGVMVQGYVQWVIEDFKTAYRKLDFTDAVDPMRIVNIQLREQAEAAIKDKVATMSIDDVLADKQPIIKELTMRLRHVAEGEGQNQGLGLRIVTVQIKEAVVSSPRVWEMLQRPFRSERAKEARLAELTSETLVRQREAEAEKAAAARRIATDAEVARLKSQSEAEKFDREQSERVRRAQAEAETLEKTMAHHKDKMEQEAQLARLRLEQELIQQGMKQEARNRQLREELTLEGERRKIDNDVSATALQLRLIQALPDVAAKMPKPSELKTLQIGGSDGLASLLGGLLKLVDSVKEVRKTA